jgi:hypothetical protein
MMYAEVGKQLPGKVSANSQNLSRIIISILMAFDNQEWFVGRYISIHGNKWHKSLFTCMTHRQLLDLPRFPNVRSPELTIFTN